MKKKSPANAWNRSGARPVSEVLMDNTTDMQSVSRTRQNSARSSAISHKTTGPSAAARMLGRSSAEPRTARQEGAREPVLMRNYEPLPKIPWFAGWNASRSVCCPRHPPRFPNCKMPAHSRPMTRTFRSGSPRTTKRPVMGVCKPACGSVWVCPVCGAKVVERAVGVRYSKPWPCIARLWRKCIF